MIRNAPRFLLPTVVLRWCVGAVPQKQPDKIKYPKLGNIDCFLI